MNKHTPGRWYWDFDRDGNWSLQSDSADSGIMDQRNCPLIEDRILIESAPDLLEALESAVSDLFYQIESKYGAKAASKYPSIVEARKAIARAKGASQ